MTQQSKKVLTIDTRAYDLLKKESEDRFGSTGAVNAILVEILRKSVNIDVTADIANEHINMYTNVDVDHSNLHNSTQTVHLRTSQELMDDLEHEANASSQSSFSAWVSQSVLYYFRARDDYRENAHAEETNKQVDFEAIRNNWELSGDIVSEVDFQDVPKTPEIRQPLEMAYLRNVGTNMTQSGFVSIVSKLFDVSEQTAERDKQDLINNKQVYVGCEVADKISLDLDVDHMWENVLYPSKQEFVDSMEQLLQVTEKYVSHKEEQGEIKRNNENACLNTLYEIETKCGTYGFDELEEQASDLAKRAGKINTGNAKVFS